MGHLYLAWIHPFGDGNGRTARAFELRILMNGRIPAIASHLLSNFYNETRSEYYERLKETSRNGSGNPAAFISYALQGFVDELDKQIKIVLEEQLDIIWSNFIYTKFSDESSPSKLRKRDLLLDISKNKLPLDKDELRLRLSVQTLSLYGEKSSMTFYRDIKQLVSQKYLKDENGKIRANKEQLQGFLPLLK
jgi:Fic family protein